MKRDVCLEIEGGLLERLLCRAMDAGVELADARRVSPRKIVLWTDVASAGTLMDMCGRYRLNCAVLASRGRPELMNKLRRRWTLALACGLCLLLTLLFLTRLWRIDVEFIGPAAHKGDRAAMLDCIKGLGLKPGMALWDVDTEVLEKRLLAGRGDMSYIGARLQGIRLLVEAAPEISRPMLYDREYARDLVASRDGVVISVNARAGTACVKSGDTVRAGQTLIRGEEEKSKEETAPVAALGEVIARCWFEGEARESLSRTGEIRTGRSREAYALKLMGFSLQLTRCESFVSEEIIHETLPVVGLYLPLELARSMHMETRTEKVLRDPVELEGKLKALARAEALAKLDAAGVVPLCIDIWTESARTGESLAVRAVIEAQADIAVNRSDLE